MLTYSFTGFFTNDTLDTTVFNNRNFVVKDLSKTNHNIRNGIFFPKLISNEGCVKKDIVFNCYKELREYGLEKVLYLNYIYLDGMLEKIESFVIENNVISAGTEVSIVDQAESKMKATFVSLMKAFEINVDSSGYFKPFEKNFWGEERF